MYISLYEADVSTRGYKKIKFGAMVFLCKHDYNVL